MEDAAKSRWITLKSRDLIDLVRTTFAAILSALIGRALHMPEAYWAVIATLIVMQSNLGAAWRISKDRLIGTALGASAGALLLTYTGPNIAAFGFGKFAIGILCLLLRVGDGAFRYAGITLVIVMLTPHTKAPPIVAIHRFVEISTGIAVGLVVTAIWPERAAAATQ